MSGIDTSLGINSVANQIAALNAHGAQAVTTNTGVQVTGLEAAAYEFGSILAAYPTDGPALTRNAAVFQVTDADGNTSLLSLTDLADQIHSQTGFDPLIEFSSGLGASSQGYSLADISFILSTLENQYSSMSFTQLTQVDTNQALQVSDGVSGQVQTALNQLGDVLRSSATQINQALSLSPDGIGLDQAVLGDINEQALSQLNAISQTIVTNQASVAAAQAVLAAAQAGNVPSDRSAVTLAQANLARANDALSVAQANSPPLSFINNLKAAWDENPWGGYRTINGVSTGSFVRLTFRAGLDNSNTPAGNANVAAVTSYIEQLVPGSTAKGYLTAAEMTALKSALDNSPLLSLQSAVQTAQQAFDNATALFNQAKATAIANAQSALDTATASLTASESTLTNLITAAANNQLPGSSQSIQAEIAQVNTAMKAAQTTLSNLNAQLSAARSNQATAYSLAAALNSAMMAVQANPADLSAQANLDQALRAIGTLTGATFGTAAFDANGGSAILNALSQPLVTWNQVNSIGPSAWNLPSEMSLLGSSIAISGGEANGGVRSPQLYSQTLAGLLGIPRPTATGSNSTYTQADIDSQYQLVTTKLAQLVPNFQVPASASGWSATTLSSLQSALQARQTSLSPQSALTACNTFSQNAASQITSLTQSIANATATLQASQAQLQTKQAQLLAVPPDSLNSFFEKINRATGVDLRAALNPIIGNGPITSEKLNEIYSYLNQHLAVGATAFTVAPGVSSARVDQLEAALDNFTVDPVVQRALTTLGSALSSLSLVDLNPANYSLSLTTPAFNMPEVARYLNLADGTSVSLSQLFSYVEQTTDIDLSAALPNFADANGAVSWGNLNTAIALINQAIPDSSIARLPESLLTNTQSELASIQNRLTNVQSQIDAVNAQLAPLTSVINGINVVNGTLNSYGGSIPAHQNAIAGTVVGGAAYPASVYAQSLAGLLGVPQIQPNPSNYRGYYSQTELDSQYQLVVNKLTNLVPDFTVPASPSDWTSAKLTELRTALQSRSDVIRPQLTPLNATKATLLAEQTPLLAAQAVQTQSHPGFQNLSSTSTLDITTAKTNLQQIDFVDVREAVETGQASASVAAALNQGVNTLPPPVLSAAEMNAQLESGDLYVNTRGQFFLNGQPTNARDASVAAFVVGGNKLNDKLNDLMNKVNVNNTRIQIANYLSAATSAADLQARIAEQKAEYGYADILSEITGGALSDADINADTDVSGATGTFQSTLKTAINNASKNQDLDTQSLQSLTSQIQANNTAMTQMIQAFEQLLKSLAQNLA